MPVAGEEDEKRTNEIGMAIPLLENCDIEGRDITGDALLTQRKLASHIVQRKAHYHFTAKAFQKPPQSILGMMRALQSKTRVVFDYLRMTKNSLTGPRSI